MQFKVENIVRALSACKGEFIEALQKRRVADTYRHSIGPLNRIIKGKIDKQRIQNPVCILKPDSDFTPGLLRLPPEIRYGKRKS